MLENNKNKIVCVAGASSGIGEALVSELTSQGYTVIGIARRKEKIKAKYSYECDVSDIKNVRSVYSELEEKNLIPQVIISCAGIYEEDTNPKFDLDKIKKTFETNYFGTINLVDTFLPQFIKNKSGHFIVLSSIASWKPSSRGVSYSGSKAAIAMTFRGLDIAYKKLGIRFSTVYLGPVDTSMWEGKKSFIVEKPADIAKSISKIILKPKTVNYIPFISTTLSRIGLLIPDWLYAKLSTYLFK